MRKITLSLAALAIALSGSTLAANAKACPESSKNPGGEPPSCGNKPVTEVCPDGIVTGPVNDLTEGNLLDPLCQIHEGVEGATGIPV